MQMLSTAPGGHDVRSGLAEEHLLLLLQQAQQLQQQYSRLATPDQPPAQLQLQDLSSQHPQMASNFMLLNQFSSGQGGDRMPANELGHNMGLRSARQHATLAGMGGGQLGQVRWQILLTTHRGPSLLLYAYGCEPPIHTTSLMGGACISLLVQVARLPVLRRALRCSS